MTGNFGRVRCLVGAIAFNPALVSCSQYLDVLGGDRLHSCNSLDHFSMCGPILNHLNLNTQQLSINLKKTDILIDCYNM